MKKWQLLATLSVGCLLGLAGAFMGFVSLIWIPAARGVSNHAAQGLLADRAQYVYDLQLYDMILEHARTDGDLEKLRATAIDRKRNAEQVIELIDMSLAAVTGSSGVDIDKLDKIKSGIHSQYDVQSKKDIGSSESSR